MANQLNSIKLVFGGKNSPNILSQEQINTLFKLIEDNRLTVQAAGYIRSVDGVITEYKKYVLGKNNIDYIGNTLADEYEISLDKSTIGTNDAITVNIDGEVGKMVFEVDSIVVTDGDTTIGEVRNIISADENKIKVAALRKAFGANVTIVAYPSYNPLNKKTASFTINNVMATSMTIEGETAVEATEMGEITKHYTFTYSPSDYTMLPIVPTVTSDNARISNITLEGFNATFDVTDEAQDVIISAVSEELEASINVNVKFLAVVRFADQAVKDVLLNHGCDLNGDGELDEDELLNITDISNWFEGTEITSFNELGKTGVKVLQNNAFNGCENLHFGKSLFNIETLGSNCILASEYIKDKFLFLPSVNSCLFSNSTPNIRCKRVDFGKNLTVLNERLLNQPNDDIADIAVFRCDAEPEGNLYRISVNNWTRNFGIKNIFVLAEYVNYWKDNYKSSLLDYTIAAIGGSEWATAMQSIAAEEGKTLDSIHTEFPKYADKGWDFEYINYLIYGYEPPE